MKKTFLFLLVTALLISSGINFAVAQDQPAPKKDTVNMDTDAKPEFYYAIEDEENDTKDSSSGSSATILIIIGAVAVLSAAGYFLLKKKK